MHYAGISCFIQLYQKLHSSENNPKKYKQTYQPADKGPEQLFSLTDSQVNSPVP